MSGSIENSPTIGQGAEKVSDFCKQLDQLTPKIFENDKILALIYFGSRIDPTKTPREDSDLDYMVVTNGFVAYSGHLHDEIQRQIGDALCVRMECHCTIPNGNIPLINKRTPGLWKGTNPNMTYHVVAKEELRNQILNSIYPVK